MHRFNGVGLAETGALKLGALTLISALLEIQTDNTAANALYLTLSLDIGAVLENLALVYTIVQKEQYNNDFARRQWKYGLPGSDRDREQDPRPPAPFRISHRHRGLGLGVQDRCRNRGVGRGGASTVGIQVRLLGERFREIPAVREAVFGVLRQCT